MFRTTILLSCMAAVFSIIVTDPPPSENDYKYSYNIEDPTTGDSKSQHEMRQGDVVSGAYTVVGPDGNKRTVEYTADSKHGFKAVLKEEPVLQTTQHTHSKFKLEQQPTQPPYYLPANIKQDLEPTQPPFYPSSKIKLRQDPMQPPYYQSPIIQNPYTVKLRDHRDRAKGIQDVVFFTPANENEIQSDRLVFEQGKYFVPASE